MSEGQIEFLLRLYAWRAEEQQQFADILASGYLLAKASAYQSAQERTGSRLALSLNHWTVQEDDIEQARAWGKEQVAGITQTYIDLLRSVVMRPLDDSANRALGGTILAKAREIHSAVQHWITHALPQKVKQIVNVTWGRGQDDGTKQWAKDVAQWNAPDDTGKVQFQVVPGESSSDFCQNYAGETYSIADVMDVGFPSWPAHPNCIHSIEVQYLDDVPLTRSIPPSSLLERMFLFLDIDGVFSVFGSGVPGELLDEKEAWPVPLTNDFLRAIDGQQQLRPFWLTRWGEKAQAWNRRAGTSLWPVAYPLEDDEKAGKTLALQYTLLQQGWEKESVVWIQDGFSQATHLWAQRAGVILIDTTKEPVRSWMVSSSPESVHDLMKYLLPGASV